MHKVGPEKFIFNETLNASFLDELFEGDTMYAETVFEDFLRDLPAYWAKVETAWRNRNMAGLGTCIHTCKTLFGYVGITDLQELCQQFEYNCASHTPEELKAEYDILIQKKIQARHIIETEYGRLKIFNTHNE